ncbi:MAG: TIGR03905 family TSCPD domain-containing protein [Muribaculaceae bacterium]|nr:TIGR03905 family TSCPD domain-containing protein [Muribaculaceae bacterium]
MNRKFSYITHGTCSQKIHFEIDENDVVRNVSFEGGCNGNLQGLSRLVEGMKREDIIARLQGIRCGFKPTSCPDQFSRALAYVSENTQEES